MTRVVETFDLAQRHGWPNGPWDKEPDKIEWEDEVTGLACYILRHPSLGHLCGYVGVAEGHPWYGIDADNIEPSPNVHGGLTWGDWRTSAAFYRTHCPAARDLWWLGFDCAHVFDLVPGMSWSSNSPGAVYRDVQFVKAECAALASQVAQQDAAS